MQEASKYLTFIKYCFANKRKTLLNSLKHNSPEYAEKVLKYLQENKIDLKIRAEQINVSEYLKI